MRNGNAERDKLVTEQAQDLARRLEQSKPEKLDDAVEKEKTALWDKFVSIGHHLRLHGARRIIYDSRGNTYDQINKEYRAVTVEMIIDVESVVNPQSKVLEAVCGYGMHTITKDIRVRPGLVVNPRDYFLAKADEFGIVVPGEAHRMPLDYIPRDVPDSEGRVWTLADVNNKLGNMLIFTDADALKAEQFF